MTPTETTDPDLSPVNLFPEKPFKTVGGAKGEEVRVLLSQIDIPDDGPKPSASLRKSVATAGVLLTVVLKRTATNRYEIKDGKRRCKAAVLAEHEDVPARVLVFDTAAHEAATTLVTNLHRSANAVEELRAIETLLPIAGSPETVARELGIPLATIKRRLKLARLTKSARAEFDAGKLNVAVAERLSVLKPVRQNKLIAAAATRAEKDGHVFKVTAGEVREQKFAQQNKLTDALPNEMFTPETSAPKKGKPVSPSFTAADLVVTAFAEDDNKREVIAEALETLLQGAYEQGELDKNAGPSRKYPTAADYSRAIVKGHVEQARAEGRLT